MREQLECIELCLEMDEELTESLCVRIKERTGKGDIYSGCLVCCRPPDQEEQQDRALYKQIEAASGLNLQALVLMGDSNHPDICWRDNTAGHEQSRRFLEWFDDKFLLQVTEEPTKRGAYWGCEDQRQLWPQ